MKILSAETLNDFSDTDTSSEEELRVIRQTRRQQKRLQKLRRKSGNNPLLERLMEPGIQTDDDFEDESEKREIKAAKIRREILKVVHVVQKIRSIFNFQWHEEESDEE